MMVIGWLIATLSGVGGLYLSYKFDLPTGAAIVCVLGAALVTTGIAAQFRLRPAPR
jgi:ABC-type Mn2+/Zn2+ transport system permease subunit